MKRLHVLGFGRDAPSTLFRWQALAKRLPSYGWEMILQPPGQPFDMDAVARADIVVLQKRILSGRCWEKLRKFSRRLVYDADDRIWMREGRPYRGWTAWKIRRRMRSICRGTDLCLAANQIIASDLVSFGGKVETVPMSIDTDFWVDQPSSDQRGVVGWTGGPKNLPFLEEALPGILPVIREAAGWSLTIHSGEKPSGWDQDIQWEPFRPGEEPKVVSRFDIGLCPLPDDPFAAGKSPIKILQYWATGAAVVASPVGAVHEWIRHGENGLLAEDPNQWRESVQSLIQNPELRGHLVRAGSAEVAQHYSQKRISERLVSLLDAIV